MLLTLQVSQTKNQVGLFYNLPLNMFASFEILILCFACVIQNSFSLKTKIGKNTSALCVLITYGVLKKTQN